jgi:hypothetical protein
MASRKPAKFIRTKRTVFVLLPIGLFLTALFYFFGPPGIATHQQASASREGDYSVDVYSNVSETFLAPGQNANGSSSVLVVLRNSWGARVGSSWGCDLKMADVAVEWNWAEHKREVQIARTKTISLVNGECLVAAS